MMLKYFPLVLFLLVNCCGAASERTNQPRVGIGNALDKTITDCASDEIPEVRASSLKKTGPDTIDMDVFVSLFANLDLDCYDLAIENGPLQSLFNTHEYHDQVFYIRDGEERLRTFPIRGYLISFEMENDSIYHIKYLGPGEVCWFVYLVTLSADFEEIDRVELSTMGGDEEDLLHSRGCFQSRSEYLREDFFRSPVVTEALYEERISSYKLKLNPDGTIQEEVLTTRVDTISIVLENGDYVTASGNNLLRVLPQQKIQLLVFDEERQVADSLFGWYNYDGRHSFAELELLKQHTDQFGIEGFKNLIDTLRIVEKWSCLEYGNEKYYKN